MLMTHLSLGTFQFVFLQFAWLMGDLCTQSVGKSLVIYGYNIQNSEYVSSVNMKQNKVWFQWCDENNFIIYCTEDKKDNFYF